MSIATVSRVLSGAKKVSAELSARVDEAAAELGYQPNPAARVLLSGQAHSVGVVIPDLANPYFAEILKGATPAAARQGWQTLVADSDEDPDQEFEAARELSRWVDGIILCAPRMRTSQIQQIAGAAPALVTINRSVTRPAVPSVVVDYRSGMLQVIDLLHSLGHTRVVYLDGPPRSASGSRRRRALDAARADGLEVSVIPCGSDASDGHRAAEAALAQQPTAIIAFNDFVALGLLSRFDALGIRVPDDVSVIGFDDIPLSEITAPGLTTVAVPKRTVGRLAWERLSLGETLTPDARPVTSVPVELVVRGTTGPAGR